MFVLSFFLALIAKILSRYAPEYAGKDAYVYKLIMCV